VDCTPRDEIVERPWQPAVGEHRVDLGAEIGKVAPFVEWPPLRAADAHQSTRREDDVGVSCGETIAHAVTDEDDNPAGGVVKTDTFTLARPAYETLRVAVGKGHARAAIADRVVIGRHRDVGETKRRQVGPDVEAKAIADDLDQRAALARGVHERRKGRVLGHPCRLGSQQLGVARQDIHVPAHQLARADEAGVVLGVLARDLGLIRVVPAKELVAYVDERDGAVVVDQEADRRACPIGRRRNTGPVTVQA
jgi:hypothetical protein